MFPIPDYLCYRQSATAVCITIKYTGFYPSSLFPTPKSLLRSPCSEVPAPKSLLRSPCSEVPAP
ncbi:MAG: hypothetical protein F6K50_19360 [Moorea sp. SIO3I7]|uniref:hypothetical protein n=1 Tax=Moorena sp. SIO3I8 TaxID=2607833 RepID=UPI0013BF2192|nr:hypothetical protein [Moorena sp. SIO3I8]NEN97603.1 hypothetical protein [Moorena sp. SIO3I7]NEO10193.1 hypothetical protein [Moorena sp. SIO3I8]